ncbi:hypothetical protein WJX74_000416 [Apatococcus lobatus]|uniref:Cytochrome P450 n=1 Tax=Apatococcus lobatus TaxID=904363 RepID=A0AAW1R2U4_9CHLO
MWVVSDPDESRAMLSKNVDNPAYIVASDALNKSILATAIGPHYRKLKGAWTPLFLPASLQNYATLMVDAARNLVASLLPHAGAAAMDVVL